MTGTLRAEHSVDPRTFLSAHCRQISHQARQIGRRQGLPEHRLDDFVGDVMVKLLEGECRVLRVFEGRSGLSSYVSAVIVHLAQDERNRLWGKWRPSAVAKKLGQEALLLERLISRDGFGLEEAARAVRERFPELEPGKVEKLAHELPIRYKRRLVTDETLDDLPAPEDIELSLEACARRCEVLKALRRAVAALDDRTRQILVWRFERGCRVQEIADALSLRQREVFGILDTARRKLRRALEAQGIMAHDALAELGQDWSS
jgi:RNA polymerase sigma factor (sigma-70 family)